MHFPQTSPRARPPDARTAWLWYGPRRETIKAAGG